MNNAIDQAHERAGYALLIVGALIALLAAGAVFAAVLGATFGTGLMPLVYIAIVGASLAGFGTITLLGVRHYAGLSARLPGGGGFDIGDRSRREDEE